MNFHLQSDILFNSLTPAGRATSPLLVLESGLSLNSLVLVSSTASSCSDGGSGGGGSGGGSAIVVGCTPGAQADAF